MSDFFASIREAGRDLKIDETRYTVALVPWSDPDDHWSTKFERVEDVNAMREHGEVILKYHLSGLTTKQHAIRKGEFLLYESRRERLYVVI